jgi:SAM-dependent methyltransferase
MAVLDAIQMTHPTPANSLFLDIQSGTGSLTAFLQNQQMTVYGIEKSKAMIDQCLSNYPSLKIKNDDILAPITFDKNIFTHVLCTDLSIYQFKDKAQLFRNIYYWLQSNGYMILHLVDRNKYDPIIPAGKPPLLTESPQTYTTERITNTEIDFIDFTYKANVDFSKKDTTVITETFVDSLTHNVRQNEETLYMEDIGDILAIAQYCGFINHGQITLPFDKNQYIFVLERPL